MEPSEKTRLIRSSIKKIEEYEEMLDFLLPGEFEIFIELKKYIGFGDLFRRKKRMKISSKILEDLLFELISREERYIDIIINNNEESE